MAVLYIGDSLFRYLRINRPGADVRFSRGAHVEQLLEGIPDINGFQVRVSFFSCIHGYTMYCVRVRSDEQCFFAKYLRAFVSVL